MNKLLLLHLGTSVLKDRTLLLVILCKRLVQRAIVYIANRFQ